jgi:phosphatidate cytidylyltransferase
VRDETGRRVLHAIPLIIAAIVIIVLGGPWFAAALFVLGCLGLKEFSDMAGAFRPMFPAMCLGLLGIVLAAYLGDTSTILMMMAVPFVIFFVVGVIRKERSGVTESIAFSLLGLFWLAIPLAHAILLRDLPEHGAGLLVDVLIGTFAADTAAYLIGRMFGSRKLAPRLSPNKTVEGLVGGVLVGILAVWAAGLYQDWLSGFDALILGAAVALVAPVGDLFESMIKRDLGTKDTSSVFGAHGGVLDRLDAVLFTVVVGYYVALALV